MTSSPPEDPMIFEIDRLASDAVRETAERKAIDIYLYTILLTDPRGAF